MNGTIQMLEDMVSRVEQHHENNQAKFRELDDELLALKQRGAIMSNEGNLSHVQGMGDQVVKRLAENADLLAKTRSVRFTVKAAGDAVTTSQGRNIQSGGVGAPTGMPYGIQSGLRIVPSSGVSALEYHRYTGSEGAAGVQAGEGAAKGAVRPTHTAVTQSALTVAGYTNMSRQALNDSAELKQAVDVTLRRAVATSLDSAMNTGNVTPSWSGLLTLATDHTSTVYEDLWDAASEAASTMMTAGFMPDVIGISPAEWLAIVVAKNATSGDYYSGSYLAPLPETLRGMRVVISPTVTAGKCLILDSGQIELRQVEDFDIAIGYVDDQFTKNMVTVLAETRVIPVFRAVGAARLVTPFAGA
ncbi:MAG: phage major capsid protein [Rhodocyclaceae bacterium]|nr:phage major capsid protein [Rhodocyclaceae bacterium]MCP5233647.1 phage major capsid protein [Zoogloeaceae bacterium]